MTFALKRTKSESSEGPWEGSPLREDKGMQASSTKGWGIVREKIEIVRVSEHHSEP